MSAPTYDDARARIAADLAADERDYPGRSFMLIYRDDLKALLAGPPEPSVEEVHLELLGLGFKNDPGCVSGIPGSEFFVLMPEACKKIASHVQALYRSRHNG